MSSIVIVVEAITIGIIYRTAIAEEKSRLTETAKSQDEKDKMKKVKK